MQMSNAQSELATFGGGCFWCLEACFQPLRGVQRVVSGYAGGHAPDPNYQDVCTGSTGHAEVIQIMFDPSQILYKELLEIFFAMHDPTTLNRQGADVGTQYRSIILTHYGDQREIALLTIKELNQAQIWPHPIVTEIVPLTRFFSAEKYHQGYFLNNPRLAYCQAVIEPKVQKLRQKFTSRLQDSTNST
jgi:peptide-methionine (S)-S-oxide reductase